MTRECARSTQPCLSQIDVRVRFVDGIRASAGNSFFAFAPPKVVLEDAEGDEEVRCGSAVLTTSSGNATFVLPSSLPTESRISIEVIRNGRSLARSSLYLVGSFDWRERSNAVRFDALGQCALGNETVTITGALIEGNVPDTSSFALPVLFTPGLDARDERRIFFIGRRAGEIITWPHEALSSDWNAVWAVSLSRNGRVLFCGGQADGAEPQAAVDGTPERIELWKDVVWRRRRRIEPRPILSFLSCGAVTRSTHAMSSDGNLLLYVLSAWKQTRWPAFKKAFDQVYLLSLRASGDASEPTRYARFRAARVLEALGHCDLHF